MRKLKCILIILLLGIYLFAGTTVFAVGVELEPETGILDGDSFTNIKDETASGGAYVKTTKLGNMAMVLTLPSQLNGYSNIEMPFELEKEGKYILWVRKKMLTSGNDSGFIIIDDRYVYGYGSTNKTSDWEWSKITIINMDAGQHNLKLYSRESGAMVDKFIFTTDATYTPEGMGEVPAIDKVLYNNGEGSVFYALPSVVPQKGVHPRLFVKAEEIPEIKANLMHPQNIAVYEDLLSCANQDLGDPDTSGFSERILSVCLSRAFLYLINGDEEMGRSAAERAAIWVKKIAETGSSTGMDVSRSGGFLIRNLSCVYDWCYDLMTPEERSDFISGVEDLLMVSEYPYPQIFASDNDAMMNGHDSENLLLCDQLAFSIAVYDEEPFFYNTTMGLLMDQYYPARNLAYPSGYMQNGNSYGAYRANFDTLSLMMLEKIGASGFLTDSIYKLAYDDIYDTRSDSWYLRDGDGPGKHYGWKNRGMTYGNLFFAGANLGKSPYIKGFFHHSGAQDIPTDNATTGLNNAIYLIYNDTDVEIGDYTELPLTQHYGWPSTGMVARTGWDMGEDSNDVVCFMKTPERYFGGHMHFDSGQFQLYYKGMLAIDSGIYEGDPYIDENGQSQAATAWGSAHDMYYHKATVAHNCMLVYDPDEVMGIGNADGGQRTRMNESFGPSNLNQLMSDEFKIGETIGYDFGPDLHEPEYSYLEANLAYSYTEKVEKYTRSFMFLNLQDDNTPAALIVYDRIKSSNPNFKKSWLLHSVEEPEILDDGNTTIIRRTADKYDGRLINTTLLPEKVNNEKVGGPGKEYWANGKNYYVYMDSPLHEGGNWRVEISPQAQNKQDYFLNVLQVGENDETNVPLETHCEEIGDYIGIYIKDKAVFMKKDAGMTYKNTTVKADGEGEVSYIVTNLKEGKWIAIGKDGKIFGEQLVHGDNGVFYFRAPAGEYTLKWSYVHQVPQKDFNVESNVRKNEYKTLFIWTGSYFDSNAILFEDSPIVAADVFTKLVRTEAVCDINGDVLEVTVPANEIDGRDEQKIKYTVGSKSAVLNGKKVTLTKAPLLYNGRIYIPLDYVETYLTCEAAYNPLTLNISYTLPKYIVDGCNPKIQNYREKEYADIMEVTSSEIDSEKTSAYESVDGNINTHWASGVLPSYITYELLQPRTIDKLEMSWYLGASRYAYFSIYTSQDGENWDLHFEGQTTGKSANFEDYMLPNPVTAKFVKIVGRGNSKNNMTSINEIKIHCVD